RASERVEYRAAYGTSRQDHGLDQFRRKNCEMSTAKRFVRNCPYCAFVAHFVDDDKSSVRYIGCRDILATVDDTTFASAPIAGARAIVLAGRIAFLPPFGSSNSGCRSIRERRFGDGIRVEMVSFGFRQEQDILVIDCTTVLPRTWHDIGLVPNN